MNTLEKTRTFWNASPCGAQESFSQRLNHRIFMEPWIPGLIQEICSTHNDVVEIGCGQGTDGILFCSMLPQNGRYRGIDYSNDSVISAQNAIHEAQQALQLNVTPSFQVGNAESLFFENDSLDCIFSNGVLHHTAHPETAYSEVYRVLKPGTGEAYITLYRKPSLKVGVAKVLRGIQWALDRISGKDRCLYHFLYGRHFPHALGTMLLECFGVPMMEWYSKAEMRTMFNKFEILRLEPVGLNFPRKNTSSKGWSSWGYMWLIHVRKPAYSNLGS